MVVETKIGKISADQAVLARLSNLILEASAMYYHDNYIALANHAKSVADELYIALNKKGFYDK